MSNLMRCGICALKVVQANLLIQKLAPEGAKNSRMVGVTQTNWNQIKRELIAMYDIVKRIRHETGAM